MPINRALQRIEFLFKNLVQNPPSALVENSENEVDDAILQEFKIRLLGFDPENSEDQRFLNLFTPMPMDELKAYPIRPDFLLEEEKSNLDFRDYNPPDEDEDGVWDARRCTNHLAQYFRSFLLGGFPRNLGPDTFSLAHMRQLDTIRNFWSTRMLEPEAVKDHFYRHITLIVTQTCNGHDGSLLYGELAPIICAMYNRAYQLRVPEDRQESLFDNPQDIWQYDREFATEEVFPVIVISFVGPQYGRILYGQMDGEELVIGQSKHYSFEYQESAPFDFFASIALSRPSHTLSL